jgi:hypothetical protein
VVVVVVVVDDMVSVVVSVSDPAALAEKTDADAKPRTALDASAVAPIASQPFLTSAV